MTLCIMTVSSKVCHNQSIIRYGVQWSRYQWPLSTEATPSNKVTSLCRCYHKCIYVSLSPKATSLMWPQFLVNQGGLIREGLLYRRIVKKRPFIVVIVPWGCLINSEVKDNNIRKNLCTSNLGPSFYLERIFLGACIYRVSIKSNIRYRHIL